MRCGEAERDRTMTDMVSDRAYAVLSQSMAEVVGSDSKITATLMRAIENGSPVELMIATLLFEELKVSTRRQIHERAKRIAHAVH